MTKEYIERGAVCNDCDNQRICVDKTKCPVGRTSAADVVEVKHGRWVIGEKCNHKPCRIKNPDKWVTYKCSVCGYSNGRKQSDYCPNCGAKMDGE